MRFTINESRTSIHRTSSACSRGAAPDPSHLEHATACRSDSLLLVLPIGPVILCEPDCVPVATKHGTAVTDVRTEELEVFQIPTADEDQQRRGSISVRSAPCKAHQLAISERKCLPRGQQAKVGGQSALTDLATSLHSGGIPGQHTSSIAPVNRFVSKVPSRRLALDEGRC